jgi:cell division initiation protein
LKITPLDLRNQEFGRTLRGYDPEEVRVFLELVSDEFEILIKENGSLAERVKDLDEKIRDYRNMEKTLNATLIAAQQNAERYSENARNEANNILENARVESRKIVEAARREKSALEEEIERLQRTRQAHLQRLKAFLREQLNLLAGEEDIHSLTSALPRAGKPGSTTFPRSETATAPPATFRPTFSVDESELDPGPEPDGGEDRAETVE